MSTSGDLAAAGDDDAAATMLANDEDANGNSRGCGAVTAVSDCA